MSAHLFAHLTGTKTTWNTDGTGVANGYVEEFGWIDPDWSSYVLHESRNDVRPTLSLDEFDGGLRDRVRDLIGSPNWADADGTGSDWVDQTPVERDGSDWSYVLHFTRKSFDHVTGEWSEAAYDVRPLLNAPTTVYVIGHNVAGYSPESDPQTFASYGEARDAFVDYVREYADQDGDLVYQGLPDDAHDDEYPAMLALVGAMERDGDIQPPQDPAQLRSERYGVTLENGSGERVEFWLAATPTPEGWVEGE